MSIQDRLDDAALLWSQGRREGAFLSVLVAAAATARKTFPQVKSDREAFDAFMKTTHGWTIEIEHRGKLVDVDRLFYTWLRSELVHTAQLPPDVRFDPDFADPETCVVRAGGAPDYTVLLSLGWYDFLVNAVTTAQVDRSPPRR